MINPNDFIFIDTDHRPYRIREWAGTGLWLFYYHRPARKWFSLWQVRPGEVEKCLPRAVPPPLCFEFEYGTPFLPLPQMVMFEAAGPYHDKFLLLPFGDRVKLHVCNIRRLDQANVEVHVDFGRNSVNFVDGAKFNLN